MASQLDFLLLIIYFNESRILCKLISPLNPEMATHGFVSFLLHAPAFKQRRSRASSGTNL